MKKNKATFFYVCISLLIAGCGSSQNPDLVIHDLKGHVKTCVTTVDDFKSAVTFDEKGCWLSLNGVDLNTMFAHMKRNDKGQLITAVGPEDEETGHADTEEWQYDPDGKVTHHVLYDFVGDRHQEFSYNKEGQLISEKQYGYAGEDYDYTVLYTYEEIDSLGNWTKRKAFIKSYSEIDFSTKDWIGAEEWIEKREISYY